jgi:ABC-2 type transport system permease protein
LLILALIPTATYVYAIQQLSQIKSVDMGGIWGSYLGLLFIGGAFTAIGIFLSAVSKNQIVAFILSVIVCGFMLFGFNLIGGFFGHSETFVQDLGMSVHYASMSRGVIDIRDVAYFLGVIALFVVLTLNRLQAQKKPLAKRLKFFGQVLLWVIIANFVVSFVFLRLDLTSEKRYTLHRNTKELLKDLESVVYFKIYLDGDLPPGFRRLRTATKEMLEELRARNSRVQFEFVNLFNIKDEQERALKSLELMRQGITATDVGVRERGGTSRRMIFTAAEVTYQGRTEVMELLQSQVGLSSEEALNNAIQTLEYQLVSTIYKLTQRDKKSVAFIDGHAQASVFETVEAMHALDGFYDVERVRMNQDPTVLLRFSEETNEIVPAYDAIIMVRPRNRVPDIDKWTIDQYIMHGGKVLWVMESSDASLDSLRDRNEQFALEYPHNLNDMLFRYGVRVNSNLVLDLVTSTVPLVTGYVGDRPRTEFFPYPFLPILISQNQHPIVRNLNPIRSEFISSIDTLENDIDKKILLTTSPYTRTVALPAIINFEIAKRSLNPNDFQRGELPVAVLLEGEFETHFRHRMAHGLENITIPMRYRSKHTQMIVISDADIITNRYNFEQRQPFPMGFDPYTRQIYANKTFIVNCINYLLDGTLLLDLRARVVKLRLLDRQRIEQERSKWLLFTLGLPTMLVMLCAVGFMGYRKWRYAR